MKLWYGNDLSQNWGPFNFRDSLPVSALFTTTINIQISYFSGVKSDLPHQSTISSLYLFPAFPEAAYNKSRMALTVLPCLPMTFPISLLATLSSNTTVWVPSISLTWTCSGCQQVLLQFELEDLSWVQFPKRKRVWGSSKTQNPTSMRNGVMIISPCQPLGYKLFFRFLSI